nr:hypothetical protein [Tanacetum cinerariifolium]
LTNEEIRNSKAYKEYYACATREAAPKPKASAKRKRSGLDTSITPPTAITTLTTTELARTEAQQLKIVLRRSRQETYISQLGGSGIDERTGSKPGVSDVPSDDSEEEISWNSSDDEDADAQEKNRDDDEGDEKDESDDGEEDDDDERDDDGDEEEITKTDETDDAEKGGDDDEETKSDDESDGDEAREEESFDPIPRTPEDSEDDGNGMESIFATASSPVAPLQTSTPIMTPSTIAIITTISHAPIPPTTIPSDVLQNLPTFDSRIVKEQVKSQVKEQVLKILPRIKQSVNAKLEAEVLTRSPHSSRTSYAVTTDLSEMELKKILIEKMEGSKSIQRSNEQRNLYKALVEAYEADKIILDTYGEHVILKRRCDDDDDQGEGPSARSDRGSKKQREGKEPESASAPLKPATRSLGRSTTGSKSRQASASESAFVEEPVQTTSQIEEPLHPPKKPLTPDRDWNKTLPAAQGSTQTWISELAKQADSRSSFNEILDTPLDFSNFIMNRLRVDTLMPELLSGPTYKLMKGSCNSLTELEYHLEEPLPLISDNRGRRVIPFAPFINNDLEYLRGGASSRKVTTSVTKTKAADYRHIKWIEDLVPRTMWIQEPINYDKHALWGVSHWGRKRQQFYWFAVNQEFALDVYSKRRIIAVTDLKIVEWHNCKHLDWISKRLNLTKPDTYRSDLKRQEAYTAYLNPRGFIYQNKDKKNRLMRIDELHKFSDGTLNDFRNALDDRLKGIMMQYLPQTIWRKGDKDRAAAMIQAIDKMLKTRRIMRSLERFVGGRLYERDFQMLQRTI